MKHSKWFKWGMFSCIWIFLTSFIYDLIGLVLVFGTEEGKSMFQKFILDELNTEFILIMSLGCLLATATVFSFFLSLSKQSNKLDKLDEEILKYYEARRRLERKINDI